MKIQKSTLVQPKDSDLSELNEANDIERSFIKAVATFLFNSLSIPKLLISVVAIDFI